VQAAAAFRQEKDAAARTLGGAIQEDAVVDLRAGEFVRSRQIIFYQPVVLIDLDVRAVHATIVGAMEMQAGQRRDGAA